MNAKDIENIRSEYHAASLSEKDTDADPVKQFDKWVKQVIESQQHEHTDRVCASAHTYGMQWERVVHMTRCPSDGVVVDTTYCSLKAKEIAKNPLGALMFFCGSLASSVRIEG